jgi:predicted lipoprotein with Yx(FWY)xxD motif
MPNGAVFVDANGMTLYTFDNETKAANQIAAVNVP